MDALGRQSTNTYDDENRLTDIVTSPVTDYWVHAVFDEWGNRVQVQNGYVNATFEYDLDLRLTRRTDAINGRTFESRYEYDLNDRLKQLWYPSGNHVAYAYDHDRLSKVYDADPQTPFATGFDFHPSGGLASYTTANGIVHAVTYDARYRPEHITGSGGALDLTYTYDGVGNVLQIADTRQNMTSGFTYDSRDRLETANGAWGALSWQYDAIGNRTLQTKNSVETTYTYTTANRLDHTTTGGQTESFGYNDVGFLTSDGRGTYQYTPNNLQGEADLLTGLTWYYRYDADGQRAWKVKGSDVESTYYLRGPAGVLSEFAGEVGTVGWSVDYIYAAGRLIATTRPPAGVWKTIHVTHVGGPGRVASTPTGLDCGAACTGRFTPGSVVALTAVPGDGLTFQGWTGGCGTSSNATITVTVGSANLDCTATFSGGDPEQLTVSKSGSGSGTVSSSPGGISCGSTCSAEFAQGTWVTLTAAPASGSRFANWSGSCGTGTSSTVTLQVNGASSCTATFVHTYALTVTKTGEGVGDGLATSSPSGISCGTTCSATYDSGTSVTLTAEAGEGYEFAGWSGTGCTTSNSSVTVLVNQARNCTAAFAAPPPPGCDAGEQSACERDGGTWDSDLCECHYWWADPLLIPLDGRPIRLTGVRNGVLFDVNGDGIPDRVAWTTAGASVGLLVLDQNGNGVVDGQSEMFGQAATGRRHPEGTANSFTDLAAFDRPANGGNGDGLISAADAVFAPLRIWVDANHDGVSQPDELLMLAQAGIASIELSAQPTGRRDRYGNYFRSRAVVHLTNGHQTVVWDVFLAARLNAGAPAAAALSGAAAPGVRPLNAGLAGLGAAMVALGLASVFRRRTCRRGSSDPRVGATLIHPNPQGRLLPVSVARAGLTGLTTLAVVLLWPSASFGQSSQTWQVVEYVDIDAIGSVRAVTNAGGQVIARHDFLPFGEELTPQNEPPDKRLYTGQERDFETGQDYVGARQLRTDLGRFLAPDPMTLVPRVVGSQGVNSYAYVRNNPLRLIDPNGLEAVEPGDALPLDLYAPEDGVGDPGSDFNVQGSQDDSTEPAADPTQQTGGQAPSAPVPDLPLSPAEKTKMEQEMVKPALDNISYLSRTTKQEWGQNICRADGSKNLFLFPAKPVTQHMETGVSPGACPAGSTKIADLHGHTGPDGPTPWGSPEGSDETPAKSHPNVYYYMTNSQNRYVEFTRWYIRDFK